MDEDVAAADFTEKDALGTKVEKQVELPGQEIGTLEKLQGLDDVDYRLDGNLGALASKPVITWTMSWMIA